MLGEICPRPGWPTRTDGCYQTPALLDVLRADNWVCVKRKLASPAYLGERCHALLTELVKGQGWAECWGVAPPSWAIKFRGDEAWCWSHRNGHPAVACARSRALRPVMTWARSPRTDPGGGHTGRALPPEWIASIDNSWLLSTFWSQVVRQGWRLQFLW